jgi:hypothetical protein
MSDSRSRNSTWADVDALTDARDDEATLSHRFKDQPCDCEFEGQQGSPKEDSMVNIMEAKKEFHHLSGIPSRNSFGPLE